MATWTVITAADLSDYSVGAKVNALRSAALAMGQTDPFDRVMPDVVATVRGLIASSRRNELSATTDSVPPEAKTHVCWLVIEALQARLMGLTLKEEEKRMIDRAWQYFRDVAKGDIAVSMPDNPVVADVQQTSRISILTDNIRNFSRETLAGL